MTMQWVDVNDRLPCYDLDTYNKTWVDVWVDVWVDGERKADVLYYMGSFYEQIVDSDEDREIEGVTHWMDVVGPYDRTPTSNNESTIVNFLELLANDIEQNPDRVIAASKSFVVALRDLVDNIDVDLDEPLDDD